MPNESLHTPTSARIHDSITIHSQIDTLIDHLLRIHFGKISFQFSAVTLVMQRKIVFFFKFVEEFTIEIRIDLLFNIDAVQADLIVCQQLHKSGGQLFQFGNMENEAHINICTELYDGCFARSSLKCERPFHVVCYWNHFVCLLIIHPCSAQMI